MFAQLLKQISQLSEEDKKCIVHWIRQHYRVDWFRNLITKLQQFISVRQLPPDPADLPPTSKSTWWVSSAIKVLALLCKLCVYGYNINFGERPRCVYAAHSFDLCHSDEANVLELLPLLSHEEFYNTTLDHTDLMPDFYSWQYSQTQTNP